MKTNYLTCFSHQTVTSEEEKVLPVGSGLLSPRPSPGGINIYWINETGMKRSFNWTLKRLHFITPHSWSQIWAYYSSPQWPGPSRWKLCLPPTLQKWPFYRHLRLLATLSSNRPCTPRSPFPNVKGLPYSLTGYLLRFSLQLPIMLVHLPQGVTLFLLSICRPPPGPLLTWRDLLNCPHNFPETQPLPLLRVHSSR